MSKKHFSWLLIITVIAAVLVLLVPGKTGKESTFESSDLLPGLASQLGIDAELQAARGLSSWQRIVEELVPLAAGASGLFCGGSSSASSESVSATPACRMSSPATWQHETIIRCSASR